MLNRDDVEDLVLISDKNGILLSRNLQMITLYDRNKNYALQDSILANTNLLWLDYISLPPVYPLEEN